MSSSAELILLLSIVTAAMTYTTSSPGTNIGGLEDENTASIAVVAAAAANSTSDSILADHRAASSNATNYETPPPPPEAASWNDSSATVAATAADDDAPAPGPWVKDGTEAPRQERLVVATDSPETELTETILSTLLRTTTAATTSLLLGKNVIVSSKTRNDLVGSGSFHEKNSPKANHRNHGYVKPNVNPAFGKYTPYFEDNLEEVNVTARIGNTVVLDCEIGMLGNKTVTWSYHNADVIRLLTVGRNAYSVDQRICLYFKYPTNWRLKIESASPRDSGLYECQVATYPPLVKKIHLLVTAPILVIMDDSGRIKSGERHLKAGSALRLRCEARDVTERHNETVVWTRGDDVLSDDVSENRTTEFADGREIQVVVSTMVIERATPRHAGNYSCVVPEKAKTTVAVHVLNGELPAAVHDGNGVSRSVLNLWLIHLTVSYVFSR